MVYLPNAWPRVDEAATALRASGAPTQTDAGHCAPDAGFCKGGGVSWLSREDGAGEGSGSPQGRTPVLFSPRNLSGTSSVLLLLGQSSAPSGRRPFQFSPTRPHQGCPAQEPLATRGGLRYTRWHEMKNLGPQSHSPCAEGLLVTLAGDSRRGRDRAEHFRGCGRFSAQHCVRAGRALGGAAGQQV